VTLSPNNLKSIVGSQLPEYIRLDHPTFVAFLEAYYEWLDSDPTNLRSANQLRSVNDIDTTFDQFVTNFKEQFLLGFPSTLAKNDTGQEANAKTLVKNIKDFYRAKGTEKTYELLFRILYDTNVEFYYPKVDILKASDGKWIQKKSLRVSSSSGQGILQTVGKKIYQYSGSTISASAFVTEASRFQLGVYEITELGISNINGTFRANIPLFYDTDDGPQAKEATVYSVVASISITSGGTGYKVGDKLVFTNATNDPGQGAKARVQQVSSVGAILKIKIDNFGVNYLTAPTISSIVTKDGTGFVGTVTLAAINAFEGYYANNDGKLSSTKVIQDSHYYQNYSYVLKTEVVISRYREIIKRLIHPAGLGFFGQISIKRCTEASLDSHSSLFKYEIPRIGHYAPYTGQTYDDLAEWFLYGNEPSGYDRTIHDPIILRSSSNPVTAGVSFTVGSAYDSDVAYPHASPFWIVYTHPNRRIVGNVIAKVDYSQKKDFCGSTAGGVSGWSEWTESDPTNRLAWESSFTGGYKYAILNYDKSSEFRKITVRSFMHMPVGDAFDCRLNSNGGYTAMGPTYGSLPQV
jgi:hypothetical protein